MKSGPREWRNECGHDIAKVEWALDVSTTLPAGSAGSP